MTENTEVEVLDAGAFDLDAWISGHHTYPEYTVTVHLDKAAVVASNKLASEVEKLEGDFKRLQEIVENGSDSVSLGEESETSKRYRVVAQELKAKKAERSAILDKAKGSALRVVLRKPPVDDDGQQGNAFDQVRKVLMEQYPEHSKVLNSMDQDATRELFTEHPEVAHQQSVLLFHIMIASITNAKEQVIGRGPKLTQAAISTLIKRLEASDLNRLQVNANLAMSGAELREEQIDAGFPG